MQDRVIPKTPKGLAQVPGHRRFDSQTMSMIVGMASEITVLRARLDTLERLLIAGGPLTAGAIDSFDPDAAAQAERDALRRNALQKIFRSMQELGQSELADLDTQQAQKAAQ